MCGPIQCLPVTLPSSARTPGYWTSFPQSRSVSASSLQIGVRPPSLASFTRLFDCLAAHPTAGAAAVSVTDDSSDPPRWRFYELSASGTLQAKLELDASEAQVCPLVQREVDGVSVALPSQSGVEVYRARGAGPLEHVTTFRVEDEALKIRSGSAS